MGLTAQHQGVRRLATNVAQAQLLAAASVQVHQMAVRRGDSLLRTVELATPAATWQL